MRSADLITKINVNRDFPLSLVFLTSSRHYRRLLHIVLIYSRSHFPDYVYSSQTSSFIFKNKTRKPIFFHMPRTRPST